MGVKCEVRPAAYIDEPFSIDPMLGVAVNRSREAVLQAVLHILDMSSKNSYYWTSQSRGIQLEESMSKEREEDDYIFRHVRPPTNGGFVRIFRQAAQSESCHSAFFCMGKFYQPLTFHISRSTSFIPRCHS